MKATSVDAELKCSNPSCGNPFDSDQGSFYRLRSSVGKPVIQRYWLCESCAKMYTLNYASGGGMQVVSRDAGPDPFRAMRAQQRRARNAA